jgi:hypothetical protein
MVVYGIQKLHIHGALFDASSETYESINPANDDVLALT